MKVKKLSLETNAEDSQRALLASFQILLEKPCKSVALLKSELKYPDERRSDV
jgi:hypothetical protein